MNISCVISSLHMFLFILLVNVLLPSCTAFLGPACETWIVAHTYVPYSLFLADPPTRARHYNPNSFTSTLTPIRTENPLLLSVRLYYHSLLSRSLSTIPMIPSTTPTTIMTSSTSSVPVTVSSSKATSQLTPDIVERCCHLSRILVKDKERAMLEVSQGWIPSKYVEILINVLE